MAFSGFQDFNPDFRSRLEELIAARPGISINSGYRDIKRQGELFADAVKKYGSVEAARVHVAPPGKSRHNFGLAADLAYATPEDRAWAHANAAQYGLNFRMGHEPWHIELAGEQPQMIAQAGTNVPVSGSQAMVAPPVPESKGYQSPGSSFVPTEFKSDYSIGKVGDILELASLISPKRSAKAEQILKNIRTYS